MNQKRDSLGGGRGSRSEAMLFSLTEFAFVLVFLCIAALGLLYAAYELGNRQVRSLQQLTDTLEAEVGFLRELLDEKQYGVVPCWRRPEQKVPPLIGSVRIAGQTEYEIEHRAGNSHDSTPAHLLSDIQALFAPDLTYAAEMNCYLRIAVRNETNSFAYYREVSDQLRRNGLVVVNE